MSRVVWKYTLRPGTNTFELPSLTVPVSVGFQGEDLRLWCLVREGAPATVARHFVVLPTGFSSYPYDDHALVPIGTAIHGWGNVWHVFEVK